MTEHHGNHPDEQQLWRLVHGEPETAIEAHVATCDQCRSELETLRSLAQYHTTTGGGMADPPPTLEMRVASLFHQVRPDLVKERRSPLETVRETLRRITADLIMDTGVSPQVAGLRSVDRRTRQIAFVSDVADLDLEVNQQADANVIAGQLGMDDVPPGLIIRFSADENRTVEAPVSDDGHFTVHLPSGDWIASVQIDDAVLQFPGIRV